MTVMPQPIPIPVPDDFQVQWQSPEEETLLWQWANTHFPSPVSPLGMDLAELAIAPGMEKGVKAIGTPISEMRTRRINTFGYMTLIPDLDLIAGAEERMQAAI